MTVCKLAGITVAFEHRYPYFERLVREYRTSGRPTVSVAVSEEEIQRETEGTRGLPPHLPDAAHRAVRESLALYRKFAEALPYFEGFFLHAALFAVGGEGIAVIAPSGTGKSTHLALWQQLLGDRLTVINGDKPLLRRTAGDGFLGYGTPFCGKEGWHTNAAAPVRHLLLLERAERDRITRLTPGEAFPFLVRATLPPEDEEALALLLPLLHDFLSSVQILRAEVTMDLTAAEAAFRAVFGKEPH